jgi:putative transposase
VQRTREVILATTLCEKAIRAKELGELYLSRWQVELHFDDLKTTLGMDHLKSKSRAMVERALALYHCAHNLVRALMLEAAVRAEVPLRRLSFKGSSGALLKAINGPQRPVRKTPGRWEILLGMAADDLLPVRPHRREPRATKRRPKKYQRLAGPRFSFQEVQHRHRAYLIAILACPLRIPTRSTPF